MNMNRNKRRRKYIGQTEAQDLGRTYPVTPGCVTKGDCETGFERGFDVGQFVLVDDVKCE